MARTGIIYSETGTYKTHSVREFAQWIYEKTGKPTLLLSYELGGWGACQPAIDAGIIRAFKPPADLPISYAVTVAKGYWPENDGKVAADGNRPAARMSELNFIPIDWNNVGGIAVEGLTSISQAVMRHLANKQIKTGEEATNPFNENIRVNGQEVGQQFAGNSRGHYGFVQNYIYTLATHFGALPCEYVLFTALESRTEDDDRSTLYGPQVAGKKATALVPSWVGDCIHPQSYPHTYEIEVPDPADPKQKVKQVINDGVVRYHFTSHPDPSTGIRFPAKPRVPADKIPELMQRFPGGFFVPGIEMGTGFSVYLRAVDELNAGAGDAMKAWRERMDRKRAGEQV